MSYFIISAGIVVVIALMGYFAREKQSVIAKIFSILAIVFIGFRYVGILLGCLFSCRTNELPFVPIVFLGLTVSCTVLLLWSFIRGKISRYFFFGALVVFIISNVGNVMLVNDTGSLRFTDSDGNYVYAPYRYTYEGGSIEQFSVFDKKTDTWSDYGWGERNADKEVFRRFEAVESIDGFYILKNEDTDTWLKIPESGGMSSISTGKKVDWKPYKFLTKIED